MWGSKNVWKNCFWILSSLCLLYGIYWLLSHGKIDVIIMGVITLLVFILGALIAKAAKIDDKTQVLINSKAPKSEVDASFAAVNKRIDDSITNDIERHAYDLDRHKELKELVTITSNDVKIILKEIGNYTKNK